MISLRRSSPTAVARQIAGRFKERRLSFGWSREELSRRSGVVVPTLRAFEDSGKISLERLLMLAFALNILDEFERIATTPAVIPVTLDQVLKVSEEKRRKRGKTLRKRK